MKLSAVAEDLMIGLRPKREVDARSTLLQRTDVAMLHLQLLHAGEGIVGEIEQPTVRDWRT